MPNNTARRPLRVAATVELVSLIVLLTNLFTVHVPAIASLTGPVHGCAYLFSIGAVIRDRQRTTAAVALAVIPGIGGMLALRSLPTPQARAGTAPQTP
ncbi:DUF3817 domain-containing protein [Streptomyces coeruleorubidus]|uniref:DUF3817 domain-containing protein n=1 Tax=Streptomyces coeruleorubidus TaxID=116188 RepID=UPI00187637BA|nr:DUF3817 domain-containing protein [Streptomyces bellus]GGT93051.1 hypothetical protein GCM10010244_17840 [Streptomyces bellus]